MAAVALATTTEYAGGEPMTDRLQARIAAVEQLTPTTKRFTLDLVGGELRFTPGQYVRLTARIDGREASGGYTITSSPSRTDRFELTVKQAATHPVTRFLHERVTVGDVVHVEGPKGAFTCEPAPGDRLVLVAGGIGITPLLSMVRAVDDAPHTARCTLLYSAAAPSELVQHRELEDMASRNPAIRCHFTVTRPGSETWSGRVGRVDAAWLRFAGVERATRVYVCGPPPMIDDIVRQLEQLGVHEDRVRFEKWW